jgi:glycine cleavage system transcriptional repressor
MDEKFFVFTALGRDRIGMVDEISMFLEKTGCNIHESRMAVLGGEFAVIMLAAAETDNYKNLQNSIEKFGSEKNFTIAVKETSRQQPNSAGKPYILQAYSIDAPGIVHAVTSVLHKFSINIEDLVTDTASAPWTGTPMFQLKAHILVPAGVSQTNLKEAFLILEQEKDLDIVIKPYSLDGLER